MDPADEGPDDPPATPPTPPAPPEPGDEPEPSGDGAADGAGRAVAAATGSDPLRYVLGGGDDHALLATFADAASVPAGWTVIGAVTEGEGVTVDGASYDGPAGWTAF